MFALLHSAQVRGVEDEAQAVHGVDAGEIQGAEIPVV